MEVKILKCDVPNGNHRIYPTEVVLRIKTQLGEKAAIDLLLSGAF